MTLPRGDQAAAQKPAGSAGASGGAPRVLERGGAVSARRPFRMLLERDVAEIERRLRLYRQNTPKRIAEEMRVHINTITCVSLGRHPVQQIRE